MSSADDIISVGYRFTPTDEELLCHFLRGRIEGLNSADTDPVVDMDVYSMEPWLLPHRHDPHHSSDSEWYYYVRHRINDSSTGAGKSPKRSVGGAGESMRGWWKANADDEPVFDASGRKIGYKKTLTFFSYKKKDDRKEAIKTDWIMHEYSLDTRVCQTYWVLCRMVYMGEEEYVPRSSDLQS